MTSEASETASTSRQVPLVGTLSTLEAYERPRKKRHSLSELIIDRDTQSARRADYADGSVNVPSNLSPVLVDLHAIKTRPHSTDQKRRSARHSTVSESVRRLSKAEESHPSKRLSHDWTPANRGTRRQSNPLKPRQKRRNTHFVNLPPTPTSVYFDAPGTGSEEGHRASESTTGSSVMLSSSSTDTSSVQKNTAFLYDQSPTTSSEGTSIDEMMNSGSVRALSLSSEMDTPGPITPATPAWKPRELNLLKKSSDSSYDFVLRNEKDRHLVGLGFHSPGSHLHPHEDSIRSTKASRGLAKDVLPISKSKPPSPNPSRSSNTGPRKLKLASVSGPPGSHRMRSKSRSTSPLPQSPMPSSSSRHPTSCLPILPPGPTFSLTSYSGAASPMSRTSSSGQTFGNVSNEGSKIDTSIPRPSSRQFVESPRLFDAFEKNPTPGNRSRSSSQGNSSSFTDSITAGSSRRKRPPTPLILAHSPASSYSQLSTTDSVPNFGAIVSKTSPRTSRSVKRVNEGTVGVPKASEEEQVEEEESSLPITSIAAPISTSPSQVSSVTRSDSDAQMVNGLASLRMFIGREEKRGAEEFTAQSKIEAASTSISANDEKTVQEIKEARINSKPLQLPPLSVDNSHFEKALISSMSFGFSSSPKEKKSSLQASEVSTASIDDDYLHKRVSSPLPSVSFKTDIFSSPPLVLGEKKADFEGKEEQSAVASDETLPRSTELTASPLTFFSPPQLAETEYPLSKNLSKLIIPSSVGLSSTAATTTAIEEDMATKDDPLVLNTQVVTGSSAETSLSRNPILRHSILDRPLPPLPKPKLSLVPDVPTFGYTGPISKPVERVEAPPSSPFIALDNYHYLQEEQEATSRWSSGSDSEDDRGKSTSTKKSSKMQQRKSSSSNVSGLSSKKNSFGAGAPSATTMPKKAGFFAGLGLRKKSVSNVSQASPLPVNSDSPAPGKLDGYGEFPFPVGSPASFSRQSFTTGSRRGSFSPMPSSNLSAGLNEVPFRPSPRNSLAKSSNVVSTRTSQNSSRKLMTRPSDGSIRTTASSHGIITAGLSRLYPASASHSPVLERKQSAPWDDVNNNIQGLGIQVSTEEKSGDEALLRETYHNLQQSLKSTKGSEGKLSKTDLPESLPKEQQDERRPSQASFYKQLGSVGGDSIPNSGLSSPTREAFASPSQSAFTSSDGTPRIPYASLTGGIESKMDEPKLERKTQKRSAAENAAGYDALGQSLMTKLRSASSRPFGSNFIEDEDNGSDRRVRIQQASKRPRYNSLTEEGQKWKEAHPELAFGGAIGLELLCNELSGGQTSGGRVILSTSFSDESDSGTDEYGSSDGAGRQRSGDASSGGHGKGDDQGDDDKPEEKKTWIRSEEDGEPSSSDSEDNYGASDQEQTSSSSRRGETGRLSSSSDDMPLGQRVRDPNQLQKQLRQLSKRPTKKEDKRDISAVKVEEASTKLNFALDVNDLTARLLKVQLERESINRSLAEESSCVNTTVSRNQSSASRSGANQTKKDVPPPLPLSLALNDQPKTTLQSIKTAPLASTNFQNSQPLSPITRQPMTSSTGQTNSSEASMRTALEAMPSSNQGMRGEDYRSAVVADFANTIRARSRSRSFAQPFPPSLDGKRAPPMPVDSSSKINNSIPVTSSSEAKSMDEEISLDNSVASPKDTSSAALRAPISSLDDQESSSSRVKPIVPAVTMVQHRVYLLNKHRCGNAEVGMNARIRDVVLSIMEREPLPADGRTGGWVLYDVCADLGIERPIREYEMVSDVIALRSNAQRDYFVLKKTELAPYLSFKNIPSSSASLAGWVYVQDNHRKKWNKKWLELRDNCLYVARSEKGKEEVLLCSLSSFDLYLTDATKIRMPKQHSFALRSQTSINMFESPEVDYVHYFALSDAGAARHWITAIINARTFVLRQEKSQLFRVNTSSTSAVPSNTSVNTNTNAAKQRSPLMTSTSPPFTNAAASTITKSPLLTIQQTSFAKGSLMEERFATRTTSNENMTSPPVIASSNFVRETALERQRREEVQTAERKGRREGKPLIAIIPDVTRPNIGLSSSNRL